MSPLDTESRIDRHKTITKFNFLTNNGPKTINMPRGRIVRAGFGPSGIGVVYLWVEHENPSPYRLNRQFIAVGDGEMIPPHFAYVSTAHDQSFTKTWHIYESVVADND